MKTFREFIEEASYPRIVGGFRGKDMFAKTHHYSDKISGGVSVMTNSEGTAITHKGNKIADVMGDHAYFKLVNIHPDYKEHEDHLSDIASDHLHATKTMKEDVAESEDISEMTRGKGKEVPVRSDVNTVSNRVPGKSTLKVFSKAGKMAKTATQKALEKLKGEQKPTFTGNVGTTKGTFTPTPRQSDEDLMANINRMMSNRSGIPKSRNTAGLQTPDE